MTWLALERAPGTSDLEAILELHPATAVALRDLVAAAQASVDDDLLQITALRMAQVLGVSEAVLAQLLDLDPDAGARCRRALMAWPSSPELTERERVSACYAEQFVIDHSLITDADIDAMLTHHSSAELFRFQVSIGVVDRLLRFCRIFEIEPPRGAS